MLLALLEAAARQVDALGGEPHLELAEAHADSHEPIRTHLDLNLADIAAADLDGRNADRARYPILDGVVGYGPQLPVT